MNSIIFTVYDLIQIGLLLLTCFACWRAGIKRGIEQTIDYFESEGIIESEEIKEEK